MTILEPAKCASCKTEVVAAGDGWAHAPYSEHHSHEDNLQYGTDLDEHHEAHPHDGRSIKDEVLSEHMQKTLNRKQFFKKLIGR
jgi:hypothetical protein